MKKFPLEHLNRLPLPIIAIDEGHIIKWISQHFVNKYNIKALDIIGKNFDSIFKIKSNNQLTTLNSLNKFSQTYEVSLHKIAKLGWFKIQKIALKTAEVDKLVLFSDISEYINDIQERVNSELNYHTIFQNAPNSDVLLSLDGKVLDCNHKTCEIFELSVEEMVGKSYATLINISSDLYIFYEKLAQQIRDGVKATPFSTEIDTLKGNHKILEIFPSLILKNNQPHAIHLIILDLTAEKKTEQKLSESITVFAAFMENFSGVSFIKSPEGKYIYLNKTMLNLVNLDPTRNLTYEECIGKTDFDMFSEENAKIFRKNDLQVLNTRSATQITETTKVNGTLRTWLVTKFPIANKGESPWAVAGMGVDVTEQKESEYLLKIQRDFGISLNEVIDPDELFTLCIDSGMEIPEIDMIGVYLLNKNNHIYELKYNVGGSPDFVEKMKRNQFRTNYESLLGGKQPIYRDLDYIEKSNNSIVIEEGIKSFCIIPIIVDNQVIGAFNVASRNYSSISKQTGNILELISTLLGSTLHKIWSQEKIKLNENRLEVLLELTQMSYESENEIYNFALEKGVHLTKSTHGFIAHVDPESHHISQMRIWSIHAKKMRPIQENLEYSSDVLSKGTWSEIIQTKKAVIVNSKNDMGEEHQLFPSVPREIFRYIAVPIFVRERLFAVAGLWNKDEDYEDSDVHQLTLLIEAVVSLIQKKEDEEQRQMYQKELEKTVAQIKLNESRLEALLNLNQMTEESEEKIFDFVLNESVKLTRSESGFITLLTPEGKMKNMRVWSSSFPDSPRTFEIPAKYQDLNKGVWVEVIHDKKAVVVNDTKVSSVAQRLLPPDPPISRYMLIPITIRDQLIAVAGLGNKEDEYSDLDVKQITLLLENVSTLIQKKKDEEQHQFYRRELEKTEKINALGILAGGIAHDFNNILTAVLGNISLAEMSDNTNESRNRLNEAKKAIIRSKELTQQLLTFAKGGTPIKKLSSLNTLLCETTNFVLRGSNVSASYDIPQNLWAVEIDEGQISQVINNLVLNAIQAMPNGGTLSLRAKNKIVKDDSKLPLLPGNYIVFEVEDEGVGISEKYLDQIFDPYFTTKEKGSGLGLATTFAIITNHGGHIIVSSTVGVGSKFTIYIPAIIDKQPEGDNNLNDNLIRGTGRVILMDDEEIIRKVAKRMLEKLGYTVSTTKNGKETIELYKNEMNSGNPFNLVILDLTIPAGMGGKATLIELQKMDPNVKAIVSSGYSVDPVMSEFENHGFLGIIAKPYKIEDFSRVIFSVITKK